MKRVQVLSPSEIPVNMVDADGVSSVIEVESKEILLPKKIEAAKSVGSQCFSVLPNASERPGVLNSDLEMAKIRKLIKKTKIKAAKLKSGTKVFCSRMKFVLGEEVRDIKEDGALFYKKFFAPMALDFMKKRESRIKKRDTGFLLKIYKDADGQDLDVLLARLFLGALGLKRHLKVKIIL